MWNEFEVQQPILVAVYSIAKSNPTPSPFNFYLLLYFCIFKPCQCLKSQRGDDYKMSNGHEMTDNRVSGSLQESRLNPSRTLPPLQNNLPYCPLNPVYYLHFNFWKQPSCLMDYDYDISFRHGCGLKISDFVSLPYRSMFEAKSVKVRTSY